MRTSSPRQSGWEVDIRARRRSENRAPLAHLHGSAHAFKGASGSPALALFLSRTAKTPPLPRTNAPRPQSGTRVEGHEARAHPRHARRAPCREWTVEAQSAERPPQELAERPQPPGPVHLPPGVQYPTAAAAGLGEAVGEVRVRGELPQVPPPLAPPARSPAPTRAGRRDRRWTPLFSRRGFADGRSRRPRTSLRHGRGTWRAPTPRPARLRRRRRALTRGPSREARREDGEPGVVGPAGAEAEAEAER